MASIEPIKKLNERTGKTSAVGYRVRWRNLDGKLGKKHFKKKIDAENFAGDMERDKSRGIFTDPGQGRRKFNDVADKWRATKRGIRPRTRINIEGRLENHIRPAFGQRRINSIRPEDVRLFLAELEDKGLSASTIKAIFQTFSQIMATAEIDGIIGRTPCVGLTLPRDRSKKEMHFTTPDKIGQLAEAVDPRFRMLILTAGYCGLRSGELAALQVDRVNFLKARIHVTQSVSEVRGKLITGPTKTSETREVPAPRFIIEGLAEHIAQYPSVDGYVFTSAEGKPLRHRNFYRRHYKPAVRSISGLPDDFRFHDLRHTAAALMIERSANPKQVQRILGHSTIRVTLDRYGHLFEGHADELMSALDATFTESSVPFLCPSGEIVPIQDAQKAR